MGGKEVGEERAGCGILVFETAFQIFADIKII